MSDVKKKIELNWIDKFRITILTKMNYYNIYPAANIREDPENHTPKYPNKNPTIRKRYF